MLSVKAGRWQGTELPMTLCMLEAGSALQLISIMLPLHLYTTCKYFKKSLVNLRCDMVVLQQLSIHIP